MTWTSEIVVYRLIRAADTIRRLPGGGLRPAGFKSAWPDLRDEWADQLARVGSEETRGRDRPRLSPPRPGEIDRMYQCMDWMAHVTDADHRKALMIYCRDKAHGRRFSRTCKKTRLESADRLQPERQGGSGGCDCPEQQSRSLAPGRH